LRKIRDYSYYFYDSEDYFFAVDIRDAIDWIDLNLVLGVEAAEVDWFRSIC
jgi:hypothetical protein